MATSILPGYPAYPQHSYVVTLGERRFRMAFTWRARPASWYMDLYDAEGTALALGRRLSPGWSPIASASLGERGPDGTLYCRGPEDYERMDWGDTLVLVFIPPADIDAAVGADAVATRLTFTVA